MTRLKQKNGFLNLWCVCALFRSGRASYTVMLIRQEYLARTYGIFKACGMCQTPLHSGCDGQIAYFWAMAAFSPRLLCLLVVASRIRYHGQLTSRLQSMQNGQADQVRQNDLVKSGKWVQLMHNSHADQVRQKDQAGKMVKSMHNGQADQDWVFVLRWPLAGTLTWKG